MGNDRESLETVIFVAFENRLQVSTYYFSTSVSLAVKAVHESV